SLPGGDGGVERVTLGATAGPFDAGRQARGAAARAAAAAQPSGKRLDTIINWVGRDRAKLYSPDAARSAVHDWEAAEPERPERTEVREIRRPAPRFHL